VKNIREGKRGKLVASKRKKEWKAVGPLKLSDVKEVYRDIQVVVNWKGRTESSGENLTKGRRLQPRNKVNRKGDGERGDEREWQGKRIKRYSFGGAGTVFRYE